MNAAAHDYGLNVTRVLADYPDFLIMGTAAGWTARARMGYATCGPVLEGATLDQLAARMDACRRRLDGA